MSTFEFTQMFTRLVLGEAPNHANTMLDLEAQKLVVDGKLRCWLDIDVNDSRASYQRAVDFVGAKNLTCAFAEIHGLG